MSVLGDICSGLAQYLEEELEFTFESRFQDAGQPPRHKSGYVFSSGTVPRGRRQEDATVIVRCFIPRPSRPRNPDKGLDPQELYDLVDAVKEALGEKQAAQFGVWGYNLGRTNLDFDVWAFDIEVLAFQATPFDFPSTGG